MRTNKLFLFLLAVTLVLMTGLSLGAMAQGKVQPAGSIGWLPPPEPIVPTVTVNAIEVSDGIIGFDNQTKSETVFGYSFLGQTTGSMHGSLSLSMNCTPAIPIPGGESQLTGGSWTLPVYLTAQQGGGYAGSLYGTIANGTMTWDRTGTNANVYFVLNVDAGTQQWNGVRGYATFAGTISFGEKTRQTTLSGNLVFNIMMATGLDSN
jgi:hypothetical protein